MTTSQILRAAAEQISQCGWTQGNYVSNEGGICASMAITIVCGGHAKVDSDGGYPQYAKAHDYIRKLTGPLSLPAWNDLFTTTAEDVFALFKNAANLAEAEGD